MFIETGPGEKEQWHANSSPVFLFSANLLNPTPVSYCFPIHITMLASLRVGTTWNRDNLYFHWALAQFMWQNGIRKLETIPTTTGISYHIRSRAELVVNSMNSCDIHWAWKQASICNSKYQDMEQEAHIIFTLKGETDVICTSMKPLILPFCHSAAPYTGINCLLQPHVTWLMWPADNWVSSCCQIYPFAYRLVMVINRESTIRWPVLPGFYTSRNNMELKAWLNTSCFLLWLLRDF